MTYTQYHKCYPAFSSALRHSIVSIQVFPLHNRLVSYNKIDELQSFSMSDDNLMEIMEQWRNIEK